MPWLTKNGKTMVVGAGALDDDPGVRPTAGVFYGSRAPWYVPPSDLETHEKLPGS